MNWRPGVRLVEEDEHTRIIKFSWWLPLSVIDETMEALQKDAEITGKHLTYKRGHRLVKVEIR